MKIVEKSSSIVLFSSLMSGDVFIHENEYLMKTVPIAIGDKVYYNAVSLADGSVCEIFLDESVTIPNSVELTIT